MTLQEHLRKKFLEFDSGDNSWSDELAWDSGVLAVYSFFGYIDTEQDSGDSSDAYYDFDVAGYHYSELYFNGGSLWALKHISNKID